MRHHRASDFSCKSVLYYHVLVLSGADRSSTGPVVEMPSCRTMIYHHYGCSIVQKVSSRTLKHLDSFWADTTPIRIGPYASQNDWCAVAAACPADGGARVTVEPEGGGRGRGARKTGCGDNRGAFGAYIARCVDLRYALPYGRVNLISTIPTLDTSKYVKTHSRLLSGSAPRPAFAHTWPIRDPCPNPA